MFDYSKILGDLFNRMEDSIAYLQVNNDGFQYKQANRVIAFTESYYNFTDSKFISAKTIHHNKLVLNKIDKYKDNNLVSYVKYELGFFVYIYDKYGNMIYKNNIRFFDKGLLGWITHLRLKFKYPNLTD